LIRASSETYTSDPRGAVHNNGADALRARKWRKELNRLAHLLKDVKDAELYGSGVTTNMGVLHKKDHKEP
jgi:hypothetical protein